MAGYSYSQSHCNSRSHFRAQSISGPATFSGNNKKEPPLFPSNGNSNNGGFFATSYDDVFGGPPKYATLAPRAEDYSEIFSAFRSASSSRAASIPVLDLPAVADIGSGASVFEYSDVFGGFDAVGFAVSYDELFQPFDGGDGCSDDEAWTPVGTESLSDDSDPFASSEQSQCFSNENSHQPLDNKQFSVSYHKVNLGTSMCIPNMTHVAQLNAVHGYTCVVDETTSVRETGAERLSTAEVDDIVFTVDSSSILPENHTRKTMPEMSLDDVGLKSFDGDNVHVRAYAASTSHVNSTLASVSDVNLATESSHLPPPSRLPSVAAERKGEISRSSGLKASDDCSLEVTHDSRLPPCFDMEVDASSFATASAAAMKDAMEKAQAKLKAAKVLMNRKKDGLEDFADLGLKTDGYGGNNVQTAFNECAYGDDRLQTESGRGPDKMKILYNDKRATTSSQSLPDMSAIERLNFVTEKPAEGKHGEKCSLSMNTAFTEGDGEWKKATQYYEFVTNDCNGVVPQPPSNVDGKISSFMQQYDDEHNSDSAGEVCVPEGNRRRLKTIKSVSRQEYYEKMFKVAQEVHDSMIGGHVSRDHRLTGMPQGNHREQKGKSGYEFVKNAIKIGHVQQVEEKNSGEATSNEEVKIKSTNELGDKEMKKKESKKKETEACHQEQSDQKTYGPHQGRVKEFPERKEEKRRMKELYKRVESDWSVQEIIGGAENEKRTKEAYEKQRMENKLADAIEQKKGKEQREIKEKRSKEPSENGFGGKGLQTASESLETGKTKDLKRKVEDEKLTKAFMDVFGGERLGRPCEFQENEKKIDLLLRNEDGNFVEVAVHGRGSERILEECVELGEHWKYEDAAEQLTGRQRQKQNECHEPLSGYKKSGEDPTCSNNEEKLGKLTEHGVENKPMQVDEMDEAVKILKKTGDADNQKFVSGSHIIIEWDEDQGSERSSEIELPAENECLESSGRTSLHDRNAEAEPDTPTSKFKSPRTEVDGLQHVCAHKENGEVSDVACNKESNLKTVDTADVLIDEKPTESSADETGAFDSKDERTVHALDSFDRNDSNSKSGEFCHGSQQKLKHKNEKIVQSIPDPVFVKDSNIEQAGRRRNLGDCHVLSDQKEKVKSTPAEGISGRNERGHAKNKEADHVVMSNWKENIQKRSYLPNVSQSAELKGKIGNRNCALEEKTENKGNDVEEQLRKLEEERERQREREKDRMAVEIAIREARERACADAHDQSERQRNAPERVAEEARQRMMNEARERLEKACAEARERSLADKASEARLRAERVVVEQATAEARQRAIEKAMAERATFEARERMQRSISEKYMSQRDVVMRQISMPSMHSEEFEAGDGEPAQRCKARLERHRRTVERVAKALAEKNMRDLLAQKEQAERSRLAETLDADIKRWSNGKAGNLRALLSTLQYILGPDSGWQPIPLTEVITAAAVKKAYRKATLCVHPDKLQQRGASIQHKYICEKVFDLLKEAWNRFNSEEK